MLEQASALRRIRQMKQTMTPRLPPLHNRTLTGNILDASLGLMNATPQLPHPQRPQPPRLPMNVCRDIATPISSVPVSMEMTTTPEDSTSRDPKSAEPVEGQRSVMEGASDSHGNKEIAKSTPETSDVQGSPEELTKTYGNVRLSTNSVPLRFSRSGGESLAPVITPNNSIITSVSAAEALPPAILMKDDVGTNTEQTSTISALNPSPQQLPSPSTAAITTTAATKNSHPPLPIASHPLPAPVSDHPSLPVDMSIEGSAFESSPLPLSSSSVGGVQGEVSPQPQRDLNTTFVKSSPTVNVGESAGSHVHQQATLTNVSQQGDEARTRTEHSYAMVEPQNSCSDDVRQPAPPQSGGEESSSQVNEDQMSRDIPPQAVPSHAQQIFGETGTVIQEETLMPNEEEHPNNVVGEVNGHFLVLDHSTMAMEGDETSRMSIENLVPDPGGAMEVLHDPVDLLPTIIEDQVLEVAVIEPKSDVPMPVEYTVVTQQDEPPPLSPPQQDPKPIEEDVPIQNPDADMVLEDCNESGESITIGCEVTASTMELTDVTEFSGGSSTVTTTERPRGAPDMAVAEDISCETVIITTSAMNSLSTGYSTPSGEESDGTISSVEEKQRREGERERGREGGGGRGKERVGMGEGGGGGEEMMERMVMAVDGGVGREGKNSGIVVNHEDGTESDEMFEDILKQIESAPYELRISNIVLAQLSRAVSKSPPLSGKKRKRRSASKKWTRTKSRKSNTPRKN